MCKLSVHIMLKWLGGSSSTAGGGSGNGGDTFTHVGKVFTVNEYQVVVEELIAEGSINSVCLTHWLWRGSSFHVQL